MMMPLEIEEYAAYRRDILLREAASEHRTQRATSPGQPGWSWLAAALRSLASRLDGGVQPAVASPVVAAR